jgi:hypothetical protein
LAKNDGECGVYRGAFSITSFSGDIRTGRGRPEEELLRYVVCISESG